MSVLLVCDQLNHVNDTVNMVSCPVFKDNNSAYPLTNHAGLSAVRAQVAMPPWICTACSVTLHLSH